MENKHTKYVFYVDMSGTLKSSNDDIFIGCILFNDAFKSAFREKFYREFPSLKSYNKKGTQLNHNKLRNVISFMQDKNIKMACVGLRRHIIKQVERYLKEKFKELKNIRGEVSIRFLEERIIASVYFTAFSQNAFTYYPYDCFSCMESQFDFHQSCIAIDRISHQNGYNFRVSLIPRRTEHMIKFADFVASAGRKIDKYILDTYSNFKFVDYTPNYKHLDLAFNLSRREKSKTKSI